MTTGRELIAQPASSLKEMLFAQPHEQLTALLTSSSDIKIAVPCSVLSKAARSPACKVVVQVKGSAGSELLLDCGSFWKGAPNHLVRMHVEVLLQYANEDALRMLVRKLQVQGRLELSPSFAARLPSMAAAGCKQESSGTPVRSSLSRMRLQSVPPGNADTQPTGAAKSAGAAHTTVALSSLLGAAAVGVPSQPGEQALCSSTVAAVQGQQVHATPVKAQRGATAAVTAVVGPSTDVAAATRRVSSGAQTDGVSDEEAFGIETPFKSSGASQASKGSPGSGTNSSSASSASELISLPCNPDLPPRPPCKGPRPASVSSGFAAQLPDAFCRMLSLDDWVSDQSPGGHESEAAGGLFSWLSTPIPPKSSSSATYTSLEVGEVAGQAPAAVEALHFSDDEEKQEEQGGHTLHGSAAALDALANSPQPPSALGMQPSALPPSPPSTAKSSDSSYNRVFFAPWSAVNDASTQTGTAAGERLGTGGSRTLSGTTADPASAHFDAFLQHFAAGLPHLAMTIADLHSVHGMASPIFGKAQFYMKTCLQIKDELSELMERHRAEA